MDREEALRLLKGGERGVAEWNRRRAPGDRIPDLRGADLTRAKLRVADLSGADLSEADLSEADLTAAHLRGAHLGGADLRGADLRGAHLSGAVLPGADFSGARCGYTTFGNVDLSDVKGLESITHDAPSTVGIDTLFRSGGKIPESFLLGCGAPEELMTYLPSILGSMKPTEFYSCFISFSTRDREFADRLHGRMTQEKLRVWYAPENMKSGCKVLDQLEGAIQAQHRLLIVLSEASMQSGWVETELRAALLREHQEGRQVLLPIRITSWEPVRDWKCFDADSGKDLARVVREYPILDFSNWKDDDAFEKAFARLLRDLEAKESTGTTPG
jgi:uncharacterized protein YjbI with pentapeptide repeats